MCRSKCHIHGSRAAREQNYVILRSLLADCRSIGCWWNWHQEYLAAI